MHYLRYNKEIPGKIAGDKRRAACVGRKIGKNWKTFKNKKALTRKGKRGR